MTYRPRHIWRHKLHSRKGNKVLRACLTVLLFMECSYGLLVVAVPYLSAFPLIQTEDSIRMEWVLPDSGNHTGRQDVYGIRFRLKEGNIQFYRQSQEISGH